MARLTDQTEKDAVPGADYLLHVVDPADTTNDPAGTSFKMTVANLVGGFIASLGLYFNKTTDDTDDITEGAVNKYTTVAEKAKLAGIAPGATANATDAALRDRATHTGTQPASTISDFSDAADARIANHVAQADPHAQYQKESEKDAALGYAGLDAGGKINPSQLPSIAVTDTFVVASQAAQTALTAEVGDLAVRTDQNKTYILRVTPASSFANWQELLTPTDTVVSVFGRTAVVTAQNGDYTASQITNVPAGGIAATTVQAALNELDADKANVVHTHTAADVTDFAATVRATVLTGISFASGAAITASSTVLGALGQLQKQITDLAAVVAAKVGGVEAVSGTAGASRIEDGVSGGGNIRIRRIIGAGASVVSIDGNNDIEVYTPPAGGSVTLTEIEVDMGNKSNSKRFTVAAPGMLPTSKILVFPSPSEATDRKGNDWEVDMATLTAVAGTDDFQLSVLSPYFMRGKRKLYYQVI